MSLYQVTLAVAAAISAMMLLAWVISIPLKLVSIVDTLWATGFAVSAATAYWLGPQDQRAILTLSCVVLWAARLSPYLLQRTLRHGEDHRYQAMRDKHGGSFWWVSLITIFGFQGLLMWVISWPLQVAASQGGQLGLLDFFAAIVFAIGFLFEAIADFQMHRFKKDPNSSGKVLNSGLWRYSRHPNYFGNFLMWWGFFGFAASAGYAWTVFAPLIMTFLLLKVSGVALLEKDIGERRPKYAEYQRKTSAFVPWPPKS